MSLQDALHRAQLTPTPGQPRPVQCVVSPAAVPMPDRPPLDDVRRKRWLAGLARLVAQQPFDALRHEPRLPSPHHRLGLARAPHDLGRAAAVCRGKDDIGAPYVLLRRAAIGNDASSRRRSVRVTLTTILLSYRELELIRPIWELSNE